MAQRFGTKACLLSFALALALCAAPGPARAQGLAESLTAIEGMVGQVDTARDRLERARQIYEEAKKAGIPERTAQAEADVDKAESELGRAAADLDQARVDALAREAGVDPARVRELRDSGMGWGRIAKELGVHPSALGRGRAFKEQANVQNGAGTGQGMGQGQGQGSGQGQGQGQGNKAKSKGKGKK